MNTQLAIVRMDTIVVFRLTEKLIVSWHGATTLEKSDKRIRSPLQSRAFPVLFSMPTGK